MKDNFIGRTFTTPQGGVLTVVDDNKLKCKSKRYICTCSICSKDEELWPLGSITSVSGRLNGKHFPMWLHKNRFQRVAI